jgi:hypothetical protein
VSELLNDPWVINRDKLAWRNVTSIEGEQAMKPGTFELSQNYPNPFSAGGGAAFGGNAGTAISYHLPFPNASGPAPSSAAGSVIYPVTLKVYDILGRKVATVANELGTPGKHTVKWDGKNDAGEPVSSGIYLYQLRAGSSVMTRKLVFVK